MASLPSTLVSFQHHADSWHWGVYHVPSVIRQVIMLQVFIQKRIYWTFYLVLLTDTKHSTLEDVRDLLIIVILNSFLTTNIIHLTSALQTFIQLKRSDQLRSLETSLKEHHTSLLTNETKYEEGGVDDPKDNISKSNIMSHDSTFDSVNYEDLPWTKELEVFDVSTEWPSIIYAMRMLFDGSLPGSWTYCSINYFYWMSRRLSLKIKTSI